MPKRKNRIIIDTNLWISFLLTNDFSKLDKVFVDKRVILLFSQILLDEFLEVAQRRNLKNIFRCLTWKDYYFKLKMKQSLSKLQVTLDFVVIQRMIFCYHLQKMVKRHT